MASPQFVGQASLLTVLMKRLHLFLGVRAGRFDDSAWDALIVDQERVWVLDASFGDWHCVFTNPERDKLWESLVVKNKDLRQQKIVLLLYRPNH